MYDSSLIPHPSSFLRTGMVNVITTAILFLLCLNIAQAQNERIVVEQHADTILIANKNAVENCAARFQIDVSVQGFDISVVETDTVVQKANCICTYDLDAYLTGLPVGTYTVSVFRQYLKKYAYSDDVKVLIGVATFDVVQPLPGALYARVFQSPCHGSDAVEPDPSVANEATFRAFPNPAAGNITLQLNLVRSRQFAIVVFDAAGNELAPAETLEYPSGSNDIALPSSLFRRSGVYYAALVFNDGVKMVSIHIVK